MKLRTITHVFSLLLIACLSIPSHAMDEGMEAMPQGKSFTVSSKLYTIPGTMRDLYNVKGYLALEINQDQPKGMPEIKPGQLTLKLLDGTEVTDATFPNLPKNSTVRYVIGVEKAIMPGDPKSVVPKMIIAVSVPFVVKDVTSLSDLYAKLMPMLNGNPHVLKAHGGGIIEASQVGVYFEDGVRLPKIVNTDLFDQLPDDAHLVYKVFLKNQVPAEVVSVLASTRPITVIVAEEEIYHTSLKTGMYTVEASTYAELLKGLTDQIVHDPKMAHRLKDLSLTDIKIRYMHGDGSIEAITPENFKYLANGMTLTWATPEYLKLMAEVFVRVHEAKESAVSYGVTVADSKGKGISLVVNRNTQVGSGVNDYTVVGILSLKELRQAIKKKMEEDAKLDPSYKALPLEDIVLLYDDSEGSIEEITADNFKYLRDGMTLIWVTADFLKILKDAGVQIHNGKIN